MWTNSLNLCIANVSVAQLDRAADFGSAGWGFESLQARGKIAAGNGVRGSFGCVSPKADDTARLLD